MTASSLTTRATSDPSSLLAKAHVNVPAHGTSAVSGYRRSLDLSNGYVSATYQYGGVTYTRETYASHPDDVVVVRLKQSGGGSYTGSVALSGTHGETTRADSGTMVASFAGSLAKRPGIRVCRGRDRNRRNGRGERGLGDVRRVRRGRHRVLRRHELHAERGGRLSRPERQPAECRTGQSAYRRRGVRRFPACHARRRLPGALRRPDGEPRHVHGRSARHGHLLATGGARRERRLARPGTGGELPSVRPVPRDHRLAREPAGEPAGSVAGQQQPGLDERLPHRHQYPDELLAGGPGRACPPASRPSRTTVWPSCPAGRDHPVAVPGFAQRLPQLERPGGRVDHRDQRERLGRRRLVVAPGRWRLDQQHALRPLPVHPGHRLPAEDLSAAQGRLPVLGGAPDHRSRHRFAHRRQRLVPGAGADQRQGHHLRAGTGMAAVRELRRGGRDARPRRRLRGHDRRSADQALPAAGQPEHRLARRMDDP